MFKPLDNILNFLYPPKCMSCKEILDIKVEKWICPNCLDKLVCIQDKNYIENNIAIFEYNEIMKNIIHNFKYKKHIEYGGFLGRQMAEKYFENFHMKFDYLVAVPIHANRLRERGFNQAYVLAEEISRKNEIPIVSLKDFVRIKDTKTQSKLSAMEREINLEGAFEVRNDECIRNKRLLIVDDIYTTGNTINQCRKFLMENGAEEVCSYTLAAAIRK